MTVLVQQWVSLDGFAAGPGGSEEDVFAAVADDSPSETHNLALLGQVDEVLLGRRTYEQFVTFWPTDLAAGEAMAPQVNALPKVVASATLAAGGGDLPWGDHAPARVVPDAVEHLRAAGAAGTSGYRTTVVWGSLAVTRSLLRAGLVDVLELFVAPVLLGSGTALLGEDDDAVRLELTGSDVWPGGLLRLRYAPVRSAAGTEEG